jgi:hypothetical protein
MSIKVPFLPPLTSEHAESAMHVTGGHFAHSRKFRLSRPLAKPTPIFFR